MSRVCSCVYEATFTPPDGRCYYTQTVTTPYLPYCYFTADCTRISDQTVRQIKQCPSRKLVGGPSWWEARGPGPTGPPLDPALKTSNAAS